MCSPLLFSVLKASRTICRPDVGSLTFLWLSCTFEKYERTILFLAVRPGNTDTSVLGMHGTRPGLEQIGDDHLGSLSIRGVDLPKCAAEQLLLRARAPGEGRENPEHHDHDGRPIAKRERLARGE
jgi:hypothetical protein